MSGGRGALRVCVLQPDYTGSSVDYGNYDPRRNLAQWMPESYFEHLYLKKTSTFRQLRDAASQNFDIFVNLCEGYPEWDIPGIDVIWTLEHLGLPFTGPGTRLYDPPKELMKYVAYTRGVAFPAYVLARDSADIAEAAQKLPLPLFVKPPNAGDSLGIDRQSRVLDEPALKAQAERVIADYGSALIETYIDGREFTVLVAANSKRRFEPQVFQPIEFLFPPEDRFKTYDLKVTRHNPDRNVAVREADLDRRLRREAADIFTGFEGEGYARLDFRLDAGGRLYFLDINFVCSVFYPEGYEGSADYVLRLDPLGHAGFLRLIVGEGIARHAARLKPFERRGDAAHGFGIYARRPIAAGEIVFRGEERPHRLVSEAEIANRWPADRIEVLRRYAQPLGPGIRILWHEDPNEWAPQNHACEANTAYRGLDVVAVREIAAGEELTLDYAQCYDASMTPFACHCGSPRCQGLIRGQRASI